MANQIEAVNTIAITNIEAINTITDDNLQALNTLEFTGVTDAHTLISTSTASNATSIDISSGIDSTYDVYMFDFININAATDNTTFQFQVNATDGADYNDSAITSTHFAYYHDEDDSGTSLYYDASRDAAQSTSGIPLEHYVGNGADESISGRMWLYAPSSGTYVKHWMAQFFENAQHNAAYGTHVAGYINDTTAIDDIRFEMASGNLDGLIKMYGLAKS
mgnify:FL=1